MRAIGVWLVLICAFSLGIGLQAARAEDVTLPTGVRAVWDLGKAERQSTSTREQVCLNGLWRFKPADSYTEAVPAGGTGWGYFKVPGPWPRGEGQGQSIYAIQPWADRLGSLDVVWSAREITVPPEWQGRRIGLRLENVNAYATVFIDGHEAGSIVFPGDDLDITAACSPGKTQELAIRTIAQRLNPEGTNYLSREEKVNNWSPCSYRGLCGDTFLTSAPAGERITDVKVDTSVRNWRLSIDAGLAGLTEGKSYALRARVLEKGVEVLSAQSRSFTSADLKMGRMAFDKPWEAPKLWDTDTPENMYDLSVELQEAGRTLDSYYPVRFGFREFWIEGRDFILNSSPVHLRALPLNSAMRGPVAVTASYEGARKTMSRMKWLGFNIVYGHNYGCSPGSHVSHAEVLRAADDTGMLFSFSLPHMNDYDWKEKNEKTNGYERQLEWYVRRAQNHPSVVMYSQNHNFLFCREIENVERLPLVLDSEVPDGGRTKAVYSREPILRQFDTTRPLYNHGGWSREMFTMNCYLNWVPMQERAEWFKGWAEKGVRPLFAVEYGEPTSLSFLALRDSISGPLLHQFFLPEWGAAVWGDAAFKLSEFEKGALRFEADRWRKNQPFQTWDYPNEPARATSIANFTGVQGEFIAHTWPYFRTFGLSGFNIWSEWSLCQLRPGLSLRRQDYKVDWDNLQRAGFSPDYYVPSPVDDVFYCMVTEQADWVPNTRGQALLRYNEPLLAYIAGRSSRFTAQDHNYLPGQTVEKQIIVINDSRRPVDCACQWSVSLPGSQGGDKSVRVDAGRQGRIPVQFELPRPTRAGTYELKLKAGFSAGQVQEDSFAISVLPPPDAPRASGRIALFDPKGETAEALRALGVQFSPASPDGDLSAYDVLVIGKAALTVDGPAPDLSRVRDGLKVVMFEQTSQALEKRLGFRVEEFGSRQAFQRVVGHPVLAGLSNENLRDWHGEATLVPPALPLPKLHTYLTVEWCGFKVRRPCRAGNYGNLSSVMIEKPTVGDFMPLLDCGFGLQYSPLMEYREGKGMILFCQVDVTGRTEDEPAAATLRGNIMKYVCSYSPPVRRLAVYAGEPAGFEHVTGAGARVTKYGGEVLQGDQVLIVGPGGAKELLPQAQAIAAWSKAGGQILALGLPEQEAQAFLPFKVRTEQKEHISCYFEPPSVGSFASGIGCGDLLIRDPREMPLVVGGADVIGDGVLARNANVAFCQLLPWQFDYKQLYNLKTTFRHLSFALNRVLGNMGVQFETPLIARFVSAPKPEEKRWAAGLYLDEPVEKDDPYRYFCW